MAAFPSIPIHLSAENYRTHIKNLRNEVWRNGPTEKIETITIVFPGVSQTATLYMNLAFEQHPGIDAPTSSLYTVAFGNANGTWHFGNTGVSHLPGVGFPPGASSPFEASYGSFGYGNSVFRIDLNTLKKAVEHVAAYKAGDVVSGGKDSLKEGIACLLIAVNEAVRFKKVERGIADLLAKRKYDYPTDWHLIKDCWDYHHIGLL